MNRPTKILGPDGHPFSVRELVRPKNRVRFAAQQHSIEARYDAAQTTEDNRRSWALTDGMSARAANSKEVRFRLRTRARYEVANNSIAKGVVDTLANDLIGTGPRLQMLTPDPELNLNIEREFTNWVKATHLARKLRTMRRSLAQDGEAFALFITNPRLPTLIQLDLLLVEADQVSTPYLNPIDPLAVDGIRYDLEGNPVLYSLLRRHPGDVYQIGLLADYIDARSVIHWFRVDRPGQRRGLPDIMPALDLFNQLRRYQLAVLAAAETAADHAAVVYSELPPDAEDFTQCEPFEHLEIEKRTMTTLPAGWKMSQFRAEQPTTTYDMYERRLLMTIGRCLGMPYSKVSGDHANDNYSSGRLAHQNYHKSIHVDRSDVELTILDRTLNAFIEEAWLATNIIPSGPSPVEGWPHQWFWDGFEHVDPEKEANAQAKRLASNTTTLADEWAKIGHDFRTKIRQRAEEIEMMNALGVPPYPPAPTPYIPGLPDPDQDQEASEEESEVTVEEDD